MPKRKPSGREEVLLFLIQHPLRKRLLALCVEAEEARSPKELTIPTNETLSTVGYHVRVLGTARWSLSRHSPGRLGRAFLRDDVLCLTFVAAGLVIRFTHI